MRNRSWAFMFVRSIVARVLVAGLALSGTPGFGAAGSWQDQLAAGRAQVARGAYAEAVTTLTDVVQAADPAAGRDVAWAYLYLGLAYAGLGEESPARSQFLQALKRDATIAPDATTPAASLEIFRAAVAEARELGALGALAAKPEKKRSAVGYAVLGAGLALAGTGVVLGAGKKNAGAVGVGSPPTITHAVAGPITPVDATIGVFTVQFDYMDMDGDVAHVFVNLANAGAGGVSDTLPDATGKTAGHAVVQSSIMLPARGIAVAFTLRVTDAQGHPSNTLSGTTTWP